MKLKLSILDILEIIFILMFQIILLSYMFKFFFLSVCEINVTQELLFKLRDDFIKEKSKDKHLLQQLENQVIEIIKQKIMTRNEIVQKLQEHLNDKKTNLRN